MPYKMFTRVPTDILTTITSFLTEPLRTRSGLLSNAELRICISQKKNGTPGCIYNCMYVDGKCQHRYRLTTGHWRTRTSPTQKNTIFHMKAALRQIPENTPTRDLMQKTLTTYLEDELGTYLSLEEHQLFKLLRPGHPQYVTPNIYKALMRHYDDAMVS